MNKSITIFLRGIIPQPKGSIRAFIPRGWTRPVLTSTNAKNKAWAQAVQIEAKKRAPENGPWTGPVSLQVTFFLKKPKAYPKRRDIPHIKKPDLDKLMRSLNDALTGIIYRDDSQIFFATARKEYSDDPGAIFTVSEFNDGDPGE